MLNPPLHHRADPFRLRAVGHGNADRAGLPRCGPLPQHTSSTACACPHSPARVQLNSKFTYAYPFWPGEFPILIFLFNGNNRGDFRLTGFFQRRFGSDFLRIFFGFSDDCTGSSVEAAGHRVLHRSALFGNDILPVCTPPFPDFFLAPFYLFSQRRDNLYARAPASSRRQGAGEWKEGELPGQAGQVCDALMGACGGVRLLG
jgi:hypothetical protein